MAAAQCSGTIVANPDFDAEKSSEALRKAMKGLGTDEKAIINTLTSCNAAQRQDIKIRYKTMYGKELVKDLKGELSGNFEQVILGLMETVPDYNASCVRKAIKGLGTDEEVLIETMCTATNEEMQAMKDSYKKLFKKDMEKDVADDTSGHFKRLLVSVVQCQRDPEGAVDQAKAETDAKALYDAGENKWGTDESKFNQILAGRSHAHLRAVFVAYEKLTKHSMQKAIAKEFSGDIEKGLLTVVNCVQNRPAYYASRIQQSMKGLGTNDNDLIRLCVSRAEVDMQQIKVEFKRLFKKTLESYIKGDTSGDYETVLVALCK